MNSDTPVKNPALELRSLSWSYAGKRALDNVNLTIAAGETVILLGPNGAGKTTLFSLISGLFSPREGSISIAGRDAVKNGASALAPLGIVFQAQTLDLDLSVGQNLRYYCALRGIERSQSNERIATELARFDMSDRINDKVRSLNGGHRRRVEIARAMLHNPQILLLDEPTVGLDIPTRKALIADLHGRAEQDGTALLWATHLIDEPIETDRVIVLHQGQIIGDGTPGQLRTHTGTDSLAEAFAALTEKKGDR
ncbi:MAG: ABC transporter ATP-binding protein [Burkholderiaceae bacterium]